MICKNCGNEMKEGEKYCTKCGLPVTAAVSGSPSLNGAKQEVSATADRGQAAGSQPAGQKTSAEQMKKTAVNYWAFILENLKVPHARGMKSGPLDFVYGYMTIGIMAFLFAMGSFINLRLLSNGWGGFYRYEVPFFETFFTALFYGAIGFLAIAGIMFGVLKLMMQADVRFHDVLGRFGALLTVPLALSVLFFLSSFTGVGFIQGFITFMLLCSLQAAIILAFYSFTKTASAKYDPLYGVLAMYAVFGVLIGITADTFFRYFMFSF